MKKRFVAVILTIALIISAFSVWSMVRKSQDNSFKTYASSIECNAQGDFMPAPYDNTLIAPVKPNENNELFCSMQGDIMPQGWDEEEEEDD